MWKMGKIMEKYRENVVLTEENEVVIEVN